MTRRFDEVELYPGTAPEVAVPLPDLTPGLIPVLAEHSGPAPRYRRTLSFLTDASLFAALALALTPLIPDYIDFRTTFQEEWPAIGALTGFLVLVSFFYFLGSWLVWGRTIGGTIFDVRIETLEGAPPDFERALRRWGAMYFSVLSGGIGFLLALLPGGRSLADRFSQTRAVSGG
jgi:uncharacterized RDD family membrane protein YckC